MTTIPERTTATPAPAPQAGFRADRGQVWRWILDLIPTLLTPFAGIAAAFGIVILILTWQGADPRLALDFLSGDARICR